MSDSLDPDQDQSSVGPDLFQTVCKGYQQTTKVAASKERANLLIRTPLIIIHLSDDLNYQTRDYYKNKTR